MFKQQMTIWVLLCIIFSTPFMTFIFLHVIIVWIHQYNRVGSCEVKLRLLSLICCWKVTVMLTAGLSAINLIWWVAKDERRELPPVSPSRWDPIVTKYKMLLRGWNTLHAKCLYFFILAGEVWTAAAFRPDLSADHFSADGEMIKAVMDQASC